MKATQAQIRQRVEKVLQLRLAGAEFPDVREYTRAPEPPDEPWGVSDSQLWRYIAKADALCREIFDARAEALLARHCLQRRQLYAHAVETGDYRAALAILDSEARLENLFPAQAVRHSGPKGDDPVPVDVTSGGQPLGIQLDPAACAAFLADVARLAGGVPADGATQPLDPAPAPSQAAAIPAALPDAGGPVRGGGRRGQE